MDATCSRNCTTCLKCRKTVNSLKGVTVFHVAIMIHMLQEVLKVELNRLQHFFQEVKVCRLPLNPALVVQGIEADVSLMQWIVILIF